MATNSNDVKKVSVGKPKVSGSVFVAPLGTAIPNDATTELDPAFKCLGYCSDDGLTNSNKFSTEKIKAWGGDTVINSRTDQEDTFKFKLIESLNEDVLKTVYGASNVTGTLADGLSINVNASQSDDSVFVFETILKGGHLKRMVIPVGSISELGDISYKDNEALGYEIILTALPDSDGNTHYEYMKKGA